MTPYQKFKAECEAEILDIGADSALQGLTKDWLTAANRAKYPYHFEFLGRPIIQYPQDIVAFQEVGGLTACVAAVFHLQSQRNQGQNKKN